MSNQRPDILFFFTDDQRFNTIQALGNENIITPNIDLLVEEGITFNHAHIPGASCTAVCMPSRAMLHTGRTLFHLAGSGENIPSDHITLGETLQKEGFRTFGTGKWHNGSDSYARSFTDGAEIFFGGMEDHWNVPACNFDPTGKYDLHYPAVKDPFFSNEVTYRQCDHITAGKHSSELFCEAAIDFLKNYDSEDPFFMYISFMAPHDPRTMPKEYLEMYDPEKLPLPENFMPVHPFDLGSMKVRDEMLAPFPRTPEVIRRHIAEYYAMITHLDAQIGRVLKELKRKERADNTIILLAGDNGLALGQHGLMGKQNSYDHSIRVPLVIKGPGIPMNEKRNALVYLLDIYPTLCDLVGADIPGSVEGKSLVPVFNKADEKVRDTLFFAFDRFQRAVRDDRYKLIEYVVNGERTTQLFDLLLDPIEINNLANSPNHTDVLTKLRKELIRCRDTWGDLDSCWGRSFWDMYGS